MKDKYSSNILKLIAYSIIPMLVIIICINVLSLMYYSDNKEDITYNKSYGETEQFASVYLSSIYNAVNSLPESETLEIDSLHTTETSNESDSIIKYYGVSISNKYNILIVMPSGFVYTNVEKTTKTDTLEELKDYINSKEYSWCYDKNGVTTEIEKMKYDYIAYDGRFENIKDLGCEIYVSMNDINNGETYIYDLIYKIVPETYLNAPMVITICLFLIIIAIIYITLSIGHKKEKEGIYTDALDKIPLEIVGLLSLIALAIEFILLKLSFEVLGSASEKVLVNTGITMIVFIGLIMYITLAITGVTIIRRIKAKVLIKNTIIYMLVKWLKKNTTDILFKNINTTVRLILYSVGFIIISFILVALAIDNFLFILILLAFWYYCFKKILNWLNDIKKIREKIKNMYKGNVEEKLNEEEFSGELKQVALELNDISGGLSNAIEEGLKSERLKTELITNVSHDIKTPLTSIINYVDLLKKEEIDNPKAQEYLVILDNKSQRLKKLTEDLVEASKASSGNIKLNIEKLNVKELIKQVGGEFEDKFKEKGLELIETVTDEDVYINADSKYMYRIMENIYMNIYKYSLENSRVYIDLNKDKDNIKISLKNISKEKLNITADELMQRFVRGDSSRTTEGSGLGLSIAKSLTELQNGKFNMYLDGDLFKIVIEFKEI